MTKIEYFVEIESPLEDTFSYIVDGLNTPEWHPSIRRTQRITQDESLQIGSKLRVEARVGGRDYRWEQEIIELVPNRYFKDRMLPAHGPFKKFEDWGTFEIIDATHTKWTFAMDYELPRGVIGKLVDILVVKRRVNAHHKEGMQRAKAIIEEKRKKATLQNT